MQTKVFGRDLYDNAVALYREKPGDVNYVATCLGISWRFAKRLWFGPIKAQSAWALPISHVFQAEEEIKRQAQAEREAELHAAFLVEKKRREQLEEEARRLDENVMRLGRNNTVSGLGLLARMTEGLNQLAVRLNQQLTRGTDANGNPLDIDVEKAMRIFNRYASSVKALNESAQILVTLTRLQEGKAGAIIEHQGIEDISLEEAEEMVNLANFALKRARDFKLIKGGKETEQEEPEEGEEDEGVG